jgi:hypothetical protein
MDWAMLKRVVDEVEAVTSDVERLRNVRKAAIGTDMANLNARLRWMHNGCAGYETETTALREVLARILPLQQLLQS